jgi:hypothetical protein
MNMETADSFDTLLNFYQITWRQNPENDTIKNELVHSPFSEN